MNPTKPRRTIKAVLLPHDRKLLYKPPTTKIIPNIKKFFQFDSGYLNASPIISPKSILNTPRPNK